MSRVLLFPAWAATGAALALALITPFTVGVFVAPFALAALVLLCLRTASRNESAFGLLFGPAVLILYIAYLNRGGPGQVCTSTPTSGSCQTEWNPWPLVVVGVAMLAASIALFWHTSHRHPTHKGSALRLPVG